MVENILLIIAGFFLLIKGAGILVDGSSNIAKKMKISNIIIGLTIVAIGTSLPELFVCIKSSLAGNSEIVLGSIIGSNICNILFVLGICLIIYPIGFKKGTKHFEVPISLIMIFTIFVLANNGGLDKQLTKTEGIILIVLFISYLLYTIFMAKYGEIIDHKVELIKDEEDDGLLKSIFYVIIGIVALNFGGDFVVENTMDLVENFNASERLLSLIVLSIGTSLPELITSITAILKKEDEIAIGNVLGSNIFNILLILGVSGIISPIKYIVDYNLDIMFLFIITAVLLIIPALCKKSDNIRKAIGILLCLTYLIYLVFIAVF